MLLTVLKIIFTVKEIIYRLLPRCYAVELAMNALYKVLTLLWLVVLVIPKLSSEQPLLVQNT